MFDAKNCEQVIIKSKKEILDNHLRKERSIYYDNWESIMREYTESEVMRNLKAIGSR